MYRQVDKQRRNEILVLCNRILDISPEALPIFWNVGLTQLVFDLLYLNESSNGLTNCDEDFNFTRGLISCLSKMLSNQSCATYLIQNGVLNFCIETIRFESNNNFQKNWKPSQKATLQILSISLLTKLIPCTTKEFRSINGPRYLIKFLESLIDSGNSIDKKRVDLQRTHVSLMKTCLLSILTLSEGSPISKKNLGQLNVFKHLLKILSDKNQDPVIWKICLVISSSLCQGFKANRQLFGESGGVPIVIPFLS